MAPINLGPNTMYSRDVIVTEIIQPPTRKYPFEVLMAIMYVARIRTNVGAR